MTFNIALTSLLQWAGARGICIALTLINPCPTTPSSCPYPPSHIFFSSPTLPESPPTFFAPLPFSLKAPPQRYPRRIDCNQISPPTSRVSTCTDLHFSIVLSPQSPFAVGGTSSHTVCACRRLVVNVFQAGHTGWHVDGIGRGGSGAGHWLGGRLEGYGRVMERRTVD